MKNQVDWKEILDRSSVEDKDCVLKTLEAKRVFTWNHLDNLPRKVGASICGVSTYLLVSEMIALRAVPSGVIGTAESSAIPTLGDALAKSQKRRVKKELPSDPEPEVTMENNE